jgi:hypothetical protein
MNKNTNRKIVSESWLSRLAKSAGDAGGLISGTNKLGEIESNTTEDSWLLFKAIVGPGTDEETIKEVMLRRKDDLPNLNKEFNDLIKYGKKSLEVTGKDFNNINPTKMDGKDLMDVGSSYFIFMALLGTVTYGATAAYASGWLALNALGFGMAKGVKSQYKGSKERNDDRKELKKNFGLTGKLIAKLKGVVEDKPLSQYLRDDGEDDWADFLEKGLKEKPSSGVKKESLITLRKLIREYIVQVSKENKDVVI